MTNDCGYDSAGPYPLMYIVGDLGLQCAKSVASTKIWVDPIFLCARRSQGPLSSYLDLFCTPS
jgi:hypothetical protein